jgi:hypothetical protein
MFNQRPLCIDVPNSQYAAGTKLIVYPCQHSPNQVFLFASTGQIETPANLHFCIDAFRPTGGAPQPGDVIGLWNCQGSVNQLWAAQGAYDDPTRTQFSLILARAGALCMTVTNYNAQQQTGSLTLQYCSNDNPSQRFRKF